MIGIICNQNLRQGAFNTRYDKNTDIHQIKNGALECMLEKVKKIESYDEWSSVKI